MKKLPISEQFFDVLIRNNSIYVDKTELIHQLITQKENSAFYFLARPRRFGKSLLISTLRHIFLGNRELFEGLWIEDKLTWEGEPFPVIWLDFNSISYVEDDLATSLASTLDKQAKTQGLVLEGHSAKEKFIEFIQKLYEKTGKSVVILVDEHDKPLIDFLSGDDVKEKLQYHESLLKSFYATLKSVAAQYIKFTLITGVAKVGKLSIFSDLNHLV